MNEDRVSAREFAARVGHFRTTARITGIVRVSDRGRPDGAYVSEAVLDELVMLRQVVADLLDSRCFAEQSTPDSFGPRPPGYVPRHAQPE